MLVAFLGAPGSGKTTIAVNMFSSFKNVSTTSELIVEQARQYIAKVRFDNNLPPNSPVTLTDDDQIKIALSQITLEKQMKHSCGIGTIIVSDSSALSAQLYMSEDYLAKDQIKTFFRKALSVYDLIFYCAPVDNLRLPNDSNRIHGEDKILQIQARAKALYSSLVDSGVPVEHLIGDLNKRVRDACSIALNKHVELISRS